MTTFQVFLRIPRFRADDRGATAIEFALIAPVLMLTLVGTLETGVMLAAQRQLEDAIFMASRVSKTGYADSGQTQAATVQAAMRRAASGLLDPDKITVTSKSYASYDSVGQPEPFTDLNNNGVHDSGESFTDVNGNGSYDTDQGKSGAGSASEIVVFTATYPWTIYTPLLGDVLGTKGTRTLSVQSIVKNEPY